MARIGWIEADEATGPLAAIYAARGGRLPDILKTMTHRPDFLKAIDAASEMHFTDGALSRAQHEMIASYVAALNHCHY